MAKKTKQEYVIAWTAHLNECHVFINDLRDSNPALAENLDSNIKTLHNGVVATADALVKDGVLLK